jgi:hypothetical protein
MRVKELIAALKKCDQELEVYGYCDHGQSPEKVSTPSLIYVEGTTHNLWDEYTMDSADAEDFGYTAKAILL